MKLTFLFLLIPYFLSAQFLNGSDSAFIQSHFSFLLDREKNLLNSSTISPLFSLLPGIGTSVIYNSGINKFQIFPSVSFSLSNIITSIKQKRLLASKIKRLENDMIYNYNRALERASVIKSQILILDKEIEVLRIQNKLHSKIFAYDSLLFINNELNPDSYYLSKIRLLNSSLAIASAENKRLLLVEKFKSFSSYE